MKIFIVICLVLMVAGSVWADEITDRIYTYFSRGDLSRAREEFHRLPQTSVRDGNRLFVSAILESDGNRAYDMLRAAVRSNLDGKYAEETHFRIVQLAEARGDTAVVLEEGAAFLDRWEMSPYRERLLAVLAAHSPRGGPEQERYLRLLNDEFPGSYYGQFARLVMAERAFENGHLKSATTYCRRINNSSDDNLAAASLILLSRIALEQGQAERALLNYNILREQYPHAIGQGELVDALKTVSEKQSGEESVEVFEGISYSVQMGVFAEKDNAKRMEKRAEGYGYKADIRTKTISGKTYHVVLAGQFSTMKEAEAAKRKLEMGENEVFKVVVSDER